MLKLISYRLLPWLFLLLPTLLVAQRPMRVELPARIDTRVYHLEPLGSNGLLLFYESNEVNELGHRKWYFSLYNTQLEEAWMQYVALADGMAFVQSRQDAGKTYFLFAVRDQKKAGQSGYQLLSYNTLDGNFNLLSGSLPEKAEVSGFEVIGNHAMMGVDLPRFQADILLVNLDDGSIKSVPHGLENQVVLQATSSDKNRNWFVVAAKEYQSNRFVSDLIMVFDINGNVVMRTAYKDVQERFLHSFAMHVDDDGSLLLIGSFNNPERRNRRIRDASPEVVNEAAGLVFLKVNQQGVPVSNFYDFSGFDNIYSSLSVYDLMRVRQRQTRGGRRPADEVPVNIAFQFNNPQLLSHNEQMVYTAEAFRPQYRIETRMDYDFYGRPIPYTYSIFEGYHFFNFLLAGFDKSGNMLWNNDFELRDLLTQQLSKHVLVHPDSAGIVLAYNNTGRVSAKTISESDNIAGIEQVRNETFYTNDRIQEENFSRIVHWYDNFFLTYGYQRIANNRLTTNNLRTVFYISKMAYE